jgi:outer membrane protein OmpA-like peptidoglycan-associated protein
VLVRVGVAASTITMEAFGETRNAVQTADGVREPLNRRTEVLIVLD